MRLSDAMTIKEKISSKELMYRAAMGVFNNVKWYGKIAIVCGTGNNAGDGYALAIILKENGFNPDILLIENKFSEDGEYYFTKAKQSNINSPIINGSTSFEYDIIVDCLLGTGFKGEPKANYIDVINKINNSKAYVVSVDINSGLNGDNGLASIAVQSDLTVSIGSYKYGHFLNQAKDFIKEKINVDIGIDILKEDVELLEKENVKEFFKKRINFSNKGDYGRVALMGGSSHYPGAIKLANMGQAALRAGCGVARLIVPNSLPNRFFSNILEATLYSLIAPDGHFVYDENCIDSAVDRFDAISIGPGIGRSDDIQLIVKHLIEKIKTPLLIDADGLYALSKLDLNILNNSKANIILTPHLKEFSRLTGLSVKEIQNDPVNCVKEFVNKYNVTLLLKGPSTIIANKKCVYFVDRGTSGMATAGSGDVLTGIITGLLGYNQNNIPLTVAVGAYINGLAGEIAASRFGEISMIASDTASSIGLAIKEITKTY